jgi:hypothetical protein
MAFLVFSKLTKMAFLLFTKLTKKCSEWKKEPFYSFNYTLLLKSCLNGYISVYNIW